MTPSILPDVQKSRHRQGRGIELRSPDWQVEYGPVGDGCLVNYLIKILSRFNQTMHDLLRGETLRASCCGKSRKGRVIELGSPDWQVDYGPVSHGVLS